MTVIIFFKAGFKQLLPAGAGEHGCGTDRRIKIGSGLQLKAVHYFINRAIHDHVKKYTQKMQSYNYL